MKEKKWLVPDVIDPVEKVCVQLEIPNDVKHIAAFWGALEQLSKAYNWEDSYGDGSQTAYVWRDAIAGASEAVKIGENCMLDCDDVEDCLETSSIIDIIEIDIINNEADIIINTTEITENTTEITNITLNPPDGSTYPDAPDVDIDPDPACGAAYYAVAELRAWIAEVEGLPATYPTILDAMVALLAGILSLSFVMVIDLLENIYIVPTPPSILPDFDAQLDEMRERLYCEGFDKPDFEDYVRTTLTNGDAIADYIAGVAFVTWQQWYTTGSTDLTQDCSAYLCGTWCYRFDFTLGSGVWTIIHGSVGANGIESADYNDAGVYYNASEVRLDLTAYPTVTSLRATGHCVDSSVHNTIIFWWLDHLGGGTGSLLEIRPPLWDGSGQSRDSVIDVSDWDDIKVALHVAARVGQQYTPPASGYLPFIELSGFGPNPFGVDNCP